MTDVSRLIATARTYLGVRFRHQGRSRAGVDCAGLVVVSLGEQGVSVMDAVGYGRFPYKQRLEALLAQNLGPMLPVAQMQAGDIALMRFRGDPTHVGIITGYPAGGFALIHSFAQQKMVVEHRLDAEWLGYIVGVFRP